MILKNNILSREVPTWRHDNNGFPKDSEYTQVSPSERDPSNWPPQGYPSLFPESRIMVGEGII